MPIPNLFLVPAGAHTELIYKVLQLYYCIDMKVFWNGADNFNSNFFSARGNQEITQL